VTLSNGDNIVKKESKIQDSIISDMPVNRPKRSINNEKRPVNSSWKLAMSK